MRFSELGHRYLDWSRPAATARVLIAALPGAERALSNAGRLDQRRSAQALADLAAIPLRRVPHLPLLPRVWELRDNLSAYDAAYDALAEALDAVLLTVDGPLKRAVGVRCEVEVLS